jgi:uncharacterized membrane protein
MVSSEPASNNNMLYVFAGIFLIVFGLIMTLLGFGSRSPVGFFFGLVGLAFVVLAIYLFTLT